MGAHASRTGATRGHAAPDSHAGHGHAHPHAAHVHVHAGETAGWRYGLAILLNLVIIGVQVAAGLWLSSTALLADAGHNLSDVFGLLMAALAAWLMRRPGSARRTYGFGKAGVLAALANGLLLVFACGALAFEGVDRLIHPPAQPPPGGIVILIAAIAVVGNLGSGWLLMGGAPDDVNRRAAVFHLFADAAVSAGVLVAGALILWTGARWVDPVATLLIVIVILATSWRLLVQSLDLALDAVPHGIDIRAVETWLRALPGVVAVHDLHIWPISATRTALTVHLVVPEGGSDRLIEVATDGLKSQFGIDHPTLQVEGSDCDQCGGPPA
jgi:cobalt-zinc-cadmium efflux system protein